MTNRLLPSLLAAFLLTGCAQKNTPEVKVEIPTVPIEPVPMMTHSYTQTVEPKPILYLCVSSRPPGWPVDQSMNAWNANGKNLFTTNLKEKCRDTVNFKLVTSTKYEGETEFLKESIEVRLNRNSPVKLHTLCHELGHVLGLPHNQDPRSCMNIGATVTTPSTKDLETVGKQYWIKGESARHATGQ